MTFQEASARCPESLQPWLSQQEPDSIAEIIELLTRELLDYGKTMCAVKSIHEYMKVLAYRTMLRNRRDTV